MFRPAVREILQVARPRSLPRSSQARRFLSTAPPHLQSRSWKNSAARWGVAGALLYYYNTGSVFADEPAYAVHALPETSQESETYPTLDQIAAQREKERARLQAAAPPTETSTSSQTTPADAAAPGSPDELEAEADQQGAFNEETGEINWDCPCLGGMAHGPCGEEFRSAFSCFVYSKEEPKGVDCIDKFKGMQDCFRQHPDVYGAELDDEEDANATGEPVPPTTVQSESTLTTSPIGTESSAPEGSSLPGSATNANATTREKAAQSGSDHTEAVQGKRERAVAATEQVESQHETTSESETMVPKAWHDSTGTESKGDK